MEKAGPLYKFPREIFGYINLSYYSNYWLMTWISPFFKKKYDLYMYWTSSYKKKIYEKVKVCAISLFQPHAFSESYL